MKRGLDNMDDKTKQKLIHLVALYNEIDVLKSRVRQHDTGHIKGAISVLQRRVEEIKKELLDEDNT